MQLLNNDIIGAHAHAWPRNHDVGRSKFVMATFLSLAVRARCLHPTSNCKRARVYLFSEGMRDSVWWETNWGPIVSRNAMFGKHCVAQEILEHEPMCLEECV